MNYVENARVLQGTVDLCKVPHAVYITVYYSILQYIAAYCSISRYYMYRVKAHRTFALWYMPLVYFTSLQHVREVELREGREHPVDKKTVRK